MPFTLGAAAIGGISSLVGGLFGESATSQSLDFQKQMYGTQQKNLAPYIGAGDTSLASLMKGFENGTFGPGSIPAFTAPTAAEARATPGYQFNLQQGEKAVDAGAAARGGLMTGGTIKAEQNYGAGLASGTYQQTFQNALQQYNAALQGQAQNYNELSNTAGMGLNAVTGANQSSGQMGTNFANLMTGNASNLTAAAGGIGNAVGGGLNNYNQMQLLQQYLASRGMGGGYSAAGGGNPNPNINMGDPGAASSLNIAPGT